MHHLFIALLPPKEIQVQVKKLKEEIKRKYHCENALKLPAHITLQPPFFVKDEQLIKLYKVLDKFSKDAKMFTLEAVGFGAFPPRVIFINVSNSHSLTNLHTGLYKVTAPFVPHKSIMSNENFHPHITLASRDLSQKTFHLIWNDYSSKEFNAEFLITSFFLLRHNGTSWDIHQKFKINN